MQYLSAHYLHKLTSLACSRYSCLQMYIFNDKSCLSCIYFFPMGFCCLRTLLCLLWCFNLNFRIRNQKWRNFKCGPLHDSNLVNNPAKDLKQLCQEHSRRWLVELLTASQLCVSKNKHVRMFVTMIIPNFHKSIRGTREKVWKEFN